MATLSNNDTFCPTKFVGDMGDMILSSADSVEFQLLKGGTLILKENYSPANGQIRIGGLSAVIDTVLYGELKNSGAQANLSADFTFKVGDATLLTKKLYASHQINTLDRNGAKNILSHARQDVCYPGFTHPLSIIYTATAKLCAADGSTIATNTLYKGANVRTINCDPAVLFPQNYSNGAYIRYETGAADGGDVFTSYIDHRRYADASLIRFLNMYDAPESLLVKQPIEVKPQSKDDVGVSYGTRNRYSIEPTDEYTASSGLLASLSEYHVWRDFSMSRKAEILHEGEWLPILVTKSNFTRLTGGDNLGEAKISFQMATSRLAI